MPASEPALWPRLQAYFIAGLLHAGVMLLAFPPVGLWGLAFIAPMPLIWAGWIRAKDMAAGRKRARWSGLFVVSLGTTPFHIYSQQWVLGVSAAGFVPMVVALALFAGLYVWVLSRIRALLPGVPLVLAAPVIWAANEVLRGEVVFTGYPWHLVAHPLVDAPLFPAAASLLGTYFAGFLIVMLAGAAVDSIVEGKRAWFPAAVGFAVCTIGLALLLRPGLSGAAPVRIGIVQTNIPQSNKIQWEFADRVRDFDRFCELTRQAAGAKPGLIVWPETMFPGITLSESGLAEERSAGLKFPVPRSVDSRGSVPSTEFADRLVELSKEIGIPMVVGALGIDGLRILPAPDGGVEFDQKARFNSAFLLDAGRLDPQPYNKIDLTPFGEVMPGINRWPWLQSQLMALGAGGMTFDLSPGRAARVFGIGSPESFAVVTPICFEATKPGLCRRLVRAAGDRPVVMVNLTNDGWFGRFRTGRVQHFQVARWRCIELGVPMVRAANTGVSGLIDERGRVLESGVDSRPGAWNVDGVLSGEIVPAAGRTLYARVGDLFGWAALLLAGVGLVASFVRGRAARVRNT